MRNQKRIVMYLLSLMFAMCAVVAFSACTYLSSCKHNWAEATCTEPVTCSKCGETEGESLGHIGGVATCSAKAVCDRCNSEYGELLSHNLKDATCTVAMTCYDCGATVGEPLGHTGGAATCTDKAVCERCNEEYGELNFENHSGSVIWYKLHSVHFHGYSCCAEQTDTEEPHSKVNGVCTVCGFDPTVSISSETAMAGADGVSIVVSVADNPGIIGLELTLEYDDSILTLTGATAGSALSGLVFTPADYYSNGCKFLFDGTSITNSNIKNGEILILTFDVADYAYEGEYSVMLNVKAYDRDLNRLSFKINNGGIAVNQ